MAQTKPNDKDSIEVINRRDWRAELPVSPIPMKTPVKHVLYTETETLECKSKTQCSEIVKAIQQYHMEFRGLSDIQHHFLIGGDGNIYEGRSWFTCGIDYPKRNCRITSEMTGKSIEIAFIGCFKDKELSDNMKVAANSLIHYGIKNKLIDASVVEKEGSKESNAVGDSNTDTTNSDNSKEDILKSDSTVTDIETKNDSA